MKEDIYTVDIGVDAKLVEESEQNVRVQQIGRLAYGPQFAVTIPSGAVLSGVTIIGVPPTANTKAKQALDTMEIKPSNPVTLAELNDLMQQARWWPPAVKKVAQWKTDPRIDDILASRTHRLSISILLAMLGELGFSVGIQLTPSISC